MNRFTPEIAGLALAADEETANALRDLVAVRPGNTVCDLDYNAGEMRTHAAAIEALLPLDVECDPSTSRISSSVDVEAALIKPDELKIEAPPSGPKTIVNVGRRWTTAPVVEKPERWPNGARKDVRKVNSKAMRRVLRKHARRGRVDVAIRDANAQAAHARSVTENSHTARRLLEAERAHVRAEKAKP